MDIFEDILSRFAVPVSAQAADATAQPTFGVITNTPTETNLAKIELKTQTTNQVLGKPFTVEISLDTGTIEIIEYQVVLEFEANKLSVIDSSPSQEGNQVEFIDDVFDVINQGNLVTIDSATGKGKITLIANNADQIGLAVNRPVARITFQPQALGSTSITHVAGINGTLLYNEQQVALQSTRNDLTVSIQQNTGSSTSTISSGNNTTTSTITSTASSTTSIPGIGVDPGIDEIPATGIFDSSNMPLILGVLLVLLGISAASERKKRNVK